MKMSSVDVDWRARLISSPDIAMDVTDRGPDADPDRGLDRVTSLGVVIGIASAVVAGATIWLVVTDPVTVASAIEGGEVSPLVRRLAEVLYNALAGLIAYL
jgi:hypothetical protein